MQILGSTTRIESPLEGLENLWALYDTIFESLTAADWRRKHGKDWVIADVPYHLYYFDRDLVLAALQRGRSVPPDVVADVPSNVGALNAWNEREFDRRPSDETPERSLARWREVRSEIRNLVRGLDADALDEPIFVPLMGTGWISTRAALAANIAHHWNHYTQLRLYLKRRGPIENPSVRHIGLGFYMSFFQLMARADTLNRPFTFTMDFTGQGGGAWTFQLADGRCTLAEDRVAAADLVMTQSPETFVKTFAHMHNPMLAMLTGHVRVRGLRNLGLFGKLMPPESDELSLPINRTQPARAGAAATA